MWPQTHVKLESGRANDWPFQGVASSPLIEGEHLDYVSNRGMIWCVDVRGFHDGENDGPLTTEKLTGRNDADAILAFDMMEEVGTYPHNLANSSPVLWGDLLFGARRTARTRTTSPFRRRGRRRSSRCTRDGEAGVGGQLGRGSDSPRPVVHARRRHHRRRGAGRI
jgi:hypothetical protein